MMCRSARRDTAVTLHNRLREGSVQSVVDGNIARSTPALATSLPAALLAHAGGVACRHRCCLLQFLSCSALCRTEFYQFDSWGSGRRRCKLLLRHYFLLPLHLLLAPGCGEGRLQAVRCPPPPSRFNALRLLRPRTHAVLLCTVMACAHIYILAVLGRHPAGRELGHPGHRYVCALPQPPPSNFIGSQQLYNTLLYNNTLCQGSG